MKYISFLVLGCLALVSCKTNVVYINTTDPAPVSLPHTARNVAIINRSVPSDDNKTLNAMHQATSSENLNVIKEGSAECIKGLSNALIENKRFEVIKTIDHPDLRTPVAGTFPSPLAWSEVENICRDNAADLLFVLEIFDTELKVTPLSTPTKVNTVTDVITNVAQAQANITTTIKTGWRIYDPVNKFILDQFPLLNNLTVIANASTAVNTVEAMLGRKASILQNANALGHSYVVNRLLPYPITVTRDYYIKGTGNFKAAMRKARTGNWGGAGELWLKETQNPKRKLAGRACYNMAILGEINGDLDGAIKWAQKAYEEYNNKLALHYVNILKFRKQNYQRLQNQ